MWAAEEGGADKDQTAARAGRRTVDGRVRWARNGGGWVGRQAGQCVRRGNRRWLDTEDAWRGSSLDSIFAL